MGCDIHRYVEYKNKQGEWKSTAINGLGLQNYDLFGLMEEGIRTDHDPEKYHVHVPVGMPEQMGFFAFDDFYYKVNDEYAEREYNHCISVEKAKELEEKYPYLDKQYAEDGKTLIRIQDPNWYGITYISLDEFNEIINSYKMYLMKEYNINEKEINLCSMYINAVYNYMKTFKDCGYETRLVYWFDS
jgi:hypothetical protein